MKSILKRHLLFTGLLSISILLFSASFPGFVSKEGIGLLSFIALIPMFTTIYKLNYAEAVAYGFIYGCSKYLLFNYWLKAFDPAAFAVVPIIYGLYFLALFPLIRFVYKTFPNFSFIPISFIWLFYDLFKSTNIIGFSYGILSHSMYKTHIFTGIVDIIGSYNLSLLIVFPGVLISYLISKGQIKDNLKRVIPTAAVYIAVMIFASVYTQVSKVDYSDSTKLRTSLIQHNVNSWLNVNSQSYAMAYDSLKALSKEAEKLDSELVVWPETAFTPAIEWHKKWRPADMRERYNLIMDLEDFLRETEAHYIIGNNESFNKNRDEHHNTAYLYKKDNILARYRKINLVPFTEEFPFPDKFPWLLKYVESLGAKQYLPGKEQTLFNINGIKATILICYEDAFSDLPRTSVNNGSNLLINITNDAWTDSPSAALQHLASATLRTIENRRSLVRAGTTGYTAVIDPNGEILESLPLFTKGQLTYNVPIYNEHKTIYTKYGDFIDSIGIIAFIIIVIIALFKRVYLLKFKKK